MQSYEEARWAYLSPKFREAHNKLRVTKGLPPIPDPKIDKYVPPKPQKVKPFDPSDKEFVAAVREFHGGAMPGAWAQGEGLTINGQPVSFGLNDEERAREIVARQQQRARAVAGDVDQGFRVNGRPVR